MQKEEVICYHLKKVVSFKSYLNYGKWYGYSFLSIYIEKNYKDVNMIGVAVGKKFDKISVRRNRMKRLIKEAYRINEYKFLNGYNIIIVCKNNVDVLKISFKDVEEALLGCFEKANLIEV